MNGKDSVDLWWLKASRGVFSRSLLTSAVEVATRDSNAWLKIEPTPGSTTTKVTSGGLLDFDCVVQISGQIRFTYDATVLGLSTDDLEEGANLWYTDARVMDAISGVLTTDQVVEGANLWYTDGRARGALSSIDSRLVYNAATGEFSLDMPAVVNTNLFNSDGVLSSARTLDLAGHTLKLTGAGAAGDSLFILEADNNNSNEDANPMFRLQQDGGGIQLNIGLEYNSSDAYPGTVTNGAYVVSTNMLSIGGESSVALNLTNSMVQARQPLVCLDSMGSLTSGEGIKLSHTYLNNNTSSEVFFIENDNGDFGAKLRYNGAGNEFIMSMMDWGLEKVAFSVARTSGFTTFHNGVRIGGSLNLDYVGDTAPQLELRDSDQARTASFRMPGPQDPVGNDTLLIQNNRGQRDIIFSTENGGDFRFVQDYSTDAPLDKTSFYIGHANVASSALITDPYVRIGHSEMYTARLQLAGSGVTSEIENDGGKIVMKHDGNELLNMNSSGLNMSMPKLHMTAPAGEACQLIVEADPNNTELETRNARMEFRQDGGSVVGKLGLEGSAGQTYASSAGNAFHMIAVGGLLQLGANNRSQLDVKTAGVEVLEWARSSIKNLTTVAESTQNGGSSSTNSNPNSGYAWIGPLLLQWGRAKSRIDADETFEYAVTFPSQCFFVAVASEKASQATSMSAHVLGRYNFTFNRDNVIDGAVDFRWFAIGF